MSVTVTGTDILLSDLEKMIPTDTNVDDALTAGATILADEIRSRAPTGETGNLKEAVGVGKPKSSSRGRTVATGVLRENFKGEEYYPAYVEYGHGGPHPAPPHPYVAPSYEAKKDAAWTAVKNAVIQQLNTKGL